MEKAVKREKQNGCLQVLWDTRLVKVGNKQFHFAFFPKGFSGLLSCFWLKNKKKKEKKI